MAAATPHPDFDEQLLALWNKLQKYGQEHVLQFWGDLPEDKRNALVKDVESVDLDAVQRSFRGTQDKSSDEKSGEMEPIPDESVCNNTSRTLSKQTRDQRLVGLEKVGENKVAALLMAGGQGTRLGSKNPKGMFPLGMKHGATLFELQAHRIRKLSELAAAETGKNCVVPWYIMTSGATKSGTENFLKENNFFGLDSKNIIIFEQNLIPCLTNDGKMILAEKHKLSRSPDGNGGLYAAVKGNAILDDMQSRGIEYIHVYGVDNGLVQVCDPCFIGALAETGADAGNKSVVKSSPEEKVGIICKKDGKYQVVEYSEMDPDLDDGGLVFSSGNICNHLYTIDFLQRACDVEDALVHHVAHKKIPYIDDKGDLVNPTEPNGIKLEKFVFDVFFAAKKMMVMEIRRDTEFSPLKNASDVGKDCVETVRSMIYALNRQRLIASGATFVDASGKSLDPESLTAEHVCEISPLVSYAGEGLEAYVKEPLTFPIRIGPS